MEFSRSHAGMLAVVSIFTGMLAPVLSDGYRTFAFPLTNMQWGSYIILAFLVLSFYLVSTQKWRIFRIISTLCLLVLIYLFFMSITDRVYSNTGSPLEHMSWGWLFIIVGVGFLFYATFSQGEDDNSKISAFVDNILGVIGSFTLFCLSGLIVYVSLIGMGSPKNTAILTSFFGSGRIETISGLILSPAYTSIEQLEFDRKNNSLRFIVGSGALFSTLPDAITSERAPYKTLTLGDHSAIITSTGTILIDGKAQTGPAITPQDIDDAIVGYTNSGVILYTEQDQRIYPGVPSEMSMFVKAKDTDTLVWREQTTSGQQIVKDGEKIGNPVKEIHSIKVSNNGENVIGFVTNLVGEKEIIKNGIRIEQVNTGYQKNSFQSNGLHTIYLIQSDNSQKIVYDGIILKGEYDEIREVFLEADGSSYAYFARPIGNQKYCLFTRYRGNLCGLDGYMNPRTGADGGSIIFAGFMDGVWSIYRNTDRIINDTGYHGTTITDDYVFFDTTNPKLYLFVERTQDGKYLYRKNGKILPGAWEDVGLDVWFGYDNKILTSAKDSHGWRIVEL